MKKLFVAVVAVAAALSACNNASSIKSYSEKDSVAYAIGLDYGRHLKGLDSTLNPAVVAAAISDVLNNSAKMTQEQAYEFLNEYFMVRIPARNLKASEEFLNDIAKNNPNVKRTDSGLLYEIILEGDANAMAKNDKDEVMVNYKGSLKDGKVFDENDSTKFALNRVIKGWSEGMKLVGKGGKIKLYVPSDLGYGTQGNPYGGIAPNEALVFDVEVIDVIPAAE